MVEAGRVVREYEVWGRIGGGGMSDVWLARHHTLGMPVIIKTLKPDLNVGALDRATRLVTEARLMARVPSPHVVRVYDVGTHADTPWVAQEYVDGIDLNELDHSRREALGRGLPLWFVCEMVADIAHALHAAHQHGVLHRDVKPSNLFASPELGAKLGDFGIAVATQVDDRARETCGTLRFMPPEALRGETLDRRADVYGLGATAFDLRYGHPPFPDPRVLLAGRPHVAFPAPASAEEAYFQHVVATMLALDRGGRFPTVAEPRRLLAALARDLPRPRPATLAAGATSSRATLLFGGTRIVIETGDIAAARADGIVSSANWQMQMHTGVGDALRRAGGDEIEDEARAHGEQPLGACVVTGAGRLSCRHVLHAVSAWQEASCVGRSTQRALLAAEKLGLSTLALPALGTGAAAVTFEASASAMASALRWHLAIGSRLTEVRFVLFDEARRRVFTEVLEAALLGEEQESLDHGLQERHAATAEGISGDGPTFAAPTDNLHNKT